MTPPSTPAVDFTPMIDAAREGRAQAREMLIAPFRDSVGDALIVTLIIAVLSAAVAALIWGVSTRRLDTALLGIFGAAILGAAGHYLISTTTATFSSAAWGFLLFAVIAAGGLRAARRVFNFLN